MNIQPNALYQEMQSLALEATRNKPQESLPVQSSANSSAQFGEMLSDAINTVNGLQKEAKSKVTALEMGDRNVSLAEVMIASQKSSVAFEATVQVRNKLVESYKEIMSMPV
ncbi:flagellar hook-basal body complex protein FliE [Pseudoalteromonas sp. A25]|jgi:flagellar hook-basal body complex protein FliE|uniref:flagellar hook-basal body complex protein FliE n=1 Tax=Pseudoalteromonas sp. A25 TaxID=116092 RepID=UPI001260489B|nr:flagellar hook-basal body complex protein FliE [Pseudoalteromonas sp. A25]BBN81106.1 flagellar hook-basal body complex protein FliE [Pseudoalteromonas sp. A25]